MVSERPVVNIAGCPPITDVVTATIIHYLTFGRLPELDGEVLRCSPTGSDPRPVSPPDQRTAGIERRRDRQGRAEHTGMVSLCTAIGGSRVVDLLPGDQLPRIC